jgi:hypothetical protein
MLSPTHATRIASAVRPAAIAAPRTAMVATLIPGAAEDPQVAVTASAAPLDASLPPPHQPGISVGVSEHRPPNAARPPGLRVDVLDLPVAAARGHGHPADQIDVEGGSAVELSAREGVSVVQHVESFAGLTEDRGI